MNRIRLLAAVAVCLAGASAAQAQDEPKLSPAETVRKALDTKVAIDFNANSFQDAVDFFKNKTKVTFTIDQTVMNQMGMMFNNFPGPNGQPNGGANQLINLKGDRPRVALQRLLNGMGLTYVILGDQVLITTEEFAAGRQMRQRISVNANSMPLVKLLEKISKDTAVTVVLDPRSAKDALTPVTLKLEDVSLESAVRLATELAGLKSVRVGEVVMVTSEGRAEKLRKENLDLMQQRQLSPNSGMMPPVFQQRWGMGGVAMPGRIAIGVAPNGGIAVPPPAPDRAPPPLVKKQAPPRPR